MFIDQLSGILRARKHQLPNGAEFLMKSPARRWAPQIATLIESGAIHAEDRKASDFWELADKTRNDLPDRDRTYQVTLFIPEWNIDRLSILIAEQAIRVDLFDEME